ncbi:MAG TPA: CHASE2 domain-containing protein [Bacteroidota bacterium]|nr:CHASE2 domain-containing protein [Bacteroidota bacterium]
MAALVPKRAGMITQLLLAAAASAFVLLFVSDVFGLFHFFDRLALSSYDAMVRRRGAVGVPPDSLRVVIVKISDRTEQSLPEHFPFPRSYYARVIRNLNRAGARAIGIDLMFEQPDGHGVANDTELFDAIRQAGNVVVAVKTDIASANAAITRENENYHSIFFDADSAAGSVYVPNDEDGIFRRYMPCAASPGSGALIPSFAFAVLNQYHGLPHATVAQSESGSFLYYGERIPSVDESSLLVNYFGMAGSTFPEFDFADIIDDSTFETIEEHQLHESVNTFDDRDCGILRDSSLCGKIVLIGPYFAESKDLVAIPLAPADEPSHNLMYGVELHANVIQMLLAKNFLHPVSAPASAALVCALTLLVMLSVSAIKQRAGRHSAVNETAALVLCGLLVYGVLASASILFSERNLVVPIVPPIAAIITAYAVASVYHFLGEHRQKMMIQKMFAHYLNPHIVDELIAHPEKLRLGGERKELTVMFADVGGFTNLSERIEPERVIALLNEYLGAMSDIIIAHNGTLDKYEGDAIMAFWGAPLELQNAALDACRAALAMQKKVEEIRAVWRREGKPEFSVRIGINTGEMIVGNVGSASRFDYTVIGDSVNIASRLEGANKAYGTTIMISERTASFVKEELVCRELDDLMVIGRSTPIRIFEPLGAIRTIAESPLSAALVHHAKGLECYRNRRFDEALVSFRKVLEIVPTDGPARTYIMRSERFLLEAPGPDWTGIHSLQSK